MDFGVFYRQGIIMQFYKIIQEGRNSMAGEKKTKKWRARYERRQASDNDNAFGLRFSAKLPQCADAVVEVRASFLLMSVEDMAKAATPEGYIFTGVEEIKEY